MLDVNSIKKEYPRAFEELRKWNKKYLEEFRRIKTPPGMEPEEISKEMIDGATNSLIVIYPRLLYDFFDEHHLEISVLYTDVRDWYYRIESSEDDTLAIQNNNMYTPRTVCEEAAFLEAFSLLNGRK